MAKTLVTDTDISLSSLHQQLLIKPAASNDSTTVVQIQNSAGTVVFNVDTTNNRVGIGTTTPGYALDVSGTINASTAYRVNGNLLSDASRNLLIASIYDTGLTNQLMTFGSSAVTVKNGISLTVGGTSTFYNSTASTGVTSVQVRAGANQGTTSLQMFSDVNNIQLLSVESNGNIAGWINGQYTKAYEISPKNTNATNGGVALSTLSASTMTEVMRLTATLNVGIGTTAPNVKLDVLSGTVNTAADSLTASTMTVTGPNVVFGAGANNAGVLNVETNTALGIDVGGSIGFGGRYTGTAQAQWALIKGAKENATDGDYASYLAFGTRIFGGQVTERVRINSTGNVGIGISSPTAKLHVAGGKILLDNTQGIQIKDATGTARTVLQVDGGDNLFLDSTAAGGDIYLRASGNDKLTIKATSGNVGIGTATPTSKLAVNGNVAIGLPSSITGNYGQLEVRRASSDNRVTAGFTTDTNYQTMGWLPGTDFRVGFEYSGQYHQFKVHTGAGAVTDALYIQTTTGNVGIGTTTPGNKLAIVGSGAVIRITGTNDTSAAYFQFNTSASTGLGYVGVEGSTPGATLTGTLAYATFLSAGSSGSALQLGTPGGIRATILASGNVGIGTTSPLAPLHTSLVSTATINEIGAIFERTGGPASGISRGIGIVFKDQLNATLVAGVSGIRIGPGNDWGGGLGFFTNAASSASSATFANLTERMRIDAAGNVGIGTTTPGNKLSILDTSSTTNGQLRLGYSDTYYWDIGRENTVNGRFSFINKQNNTPSELVSILTSGNVGIGTASPAYALDVTGTIRSSAGILNTTNTFEKVFSSVVSFPNAVANQAVDIRLGNLALAGYIEVELTSTYGYQPSYGKLTKLFAIGTNPNNAIYTNESRVSDALGNVADNVAIGDISWDATNSVYRIPISHIVSTGNSYTIKVRMFSDSGLAKPVFDAMTVSSIYTLTALSRNYVNYNGNVGIGTTSPGALLHVSKDQNTQTDIRFDNPNAGTAASALFDMRNGALGINDRVLFGVTGTGYTAVTGWGDAGVLTTQANISGGLILNANAGGIKFETGANGSANQRMVITNSGNVGIGTTTPSYALQVVGQINIPDTNSYIWGAGTSWISGSSASNFITFYTALTERMRITSTGNVGIGQTAPVAALHVKGGQGVPSLSADTNNINVVHSSTNAQLVTGAYATSPYAIWLQVKDSTNSGASYPLTLNPLGGNVGIGTTGPGYKLEVVGSSNTEIARVGDGTRSFGISTYTPNSGGVTFKNAGTGLISLTTAHAVLIGTSYAGLGSGVPANTVAIEGNVGIGTITPGSILALGGTAARIFGMDRNTTAATAGQGFTISSGGAIAGTANLAGGDLTLKSGISTGTGSSAIRFFTATAAGTGTADNAPTEKVTILNSGNVGIGTTSPSKLLHVAGDALINGITVGLGTSSIAGNTAVGQQTLLTITSGYGNTAIGYVSGSAITTGANNTTLGYNSGASISTGGNNIAIGQNAGTNQATGTYNVYIGAGSYASAAGVSNEIVIGAVGGKGANTAYIAGSTVYHEGSIALKSPTTVNAATYTMASTDSSLIITTTNCTITLLSAATYTGRILYIKNITAHSLTSNASNVVPLGSATAGTAILAATAGKFAMLQSDGTNWITMMSN